MDSGRGAKRIHIFLAYVGGKVGRIGTPFTQRTLDNGLWCGSHERLRQWCRLRQQGPRPVRQSKSRIRPAEDIVGMMSRSAMRSTASGWSSAHSVCDASASVVTHHRQAVEPHRAHRPNHIQSHCSLRVRGMVRRRGRFTACPVASQIGAADRAGCRKCRRDMTPHDVRLWEPRAEKEWLVRVQRSERKSPFRLS
jgi:hypothetical protein